MPNTISKQPNPSNLEQQDLEGTVNTQNIEQIPRDLVVRRATLVKGESIPLHTHNWTQLLYASSGLMSANTSDGTWIVPPHRAVWIPPGILHDVKFVRTTTMINLYLRNTDDMGLPNTCRIIGVSPLLRELIAEVARFPTLFDTDGPQGRLAQVLMDQLSTVRETAFHLPFPKDKQLRKITDAIQANPSDIRSLQQWGEYVGASSRTLARKFRKETSMTFNEWRQQARLIAAVMQLAEGVPSSRIAQELGYASQSAFTNMFRKATGKTPARYFKTDNDGSSNNKLLIE